MKIAIFYHIAQMGLGAFIYQQQLHRLYTSGLIQAADYIHFGVNGDQELFNVPDKVVVKQNQNWKEETDTLISLKEFCDKNLDYKVLYFHTKGVSRGFLFENYWRLFMEYYIIDEWKKCVEYLKYYDCCGTDYFKTYFAGNFWWANSSYINHLDNSYLTDGCRYKREAWIASSATKKIKCLQYSKMTKKFGDFYLDFDCENNTVQFKM